MSLSVFISYSVEDEQHNTKVRKFANDLRMKGIKVSIFDDMPYGEKFYYFMEGIHDLDFTLFICTPKYKKKADERLFGVGRETELMTDSINYPFDHRRFIPVLFSGDWNSSIPKWAKGKKGVDYRESSQKEFDKLIKYLRTYEESKDCPEIFDNAVIPQKNKLSRDREKKMMRYADDDGQDTVAEVILSFKFNDTGREFVVFIPQGEINQIDSTIVNVASVTRKPNKDVILGDVSERDWKEITKLLQELSQE